MSDASNSSASETLEREREAHSIPIYAMYRSKRVRILYYAGDNRFRILMPDDRQRTEHRNNLVMLGSGRKVSSAEVANR
jgi:hypothetical protein